MIMIYRGIKGSLRRRAAQRMEAAAPVPTALAGHERPRGEGRLVVLRNQASDLTAKFLCA